MPNEIQPQSQDSADEKTIEENLQEMSYDPKEDIMRQGEEVDTDLETTEEPIGDIEPSPENE